MLRIIRVAASSRRSSVAILNKSHASLSNVRKSSGSTGTWNWNNFAESNDKKSKDEGSKSQESQVLKKCAELYMSLMPLNEKVRKYAFVLRLPLDKSISHSIW